MDSRWSDNVNELGETITIGYKVFNVLKFACLGDSFADRDTISAFLTLGPGNYQWNSIGLSPIIHFDSLSRGV